MFRCTVNGDRSGVTIWRVNGSSECILAHNTAGAISTCGPSSVFTARIGTGFGLSFSSTLSGTATSMLSDTLVECFGPALSRDAGNTVGGSILQISGWFVFCNIHQGVLIVSLYVIFQVPTHISLSNLLH